MVWKFITDNWDIIRMYPALFSGAIFVGWLAGWAIIQLVYNQRLAHQADMIVKLRAVLEEKLPANFLPQPKQTWPMSFPLILGGLGLAFIGLAIATIGIFWQSPAQRPQQSSTPQVSEATPTKPISSLLPDDGGPIKWNPGYLLGASGRDNGMVLSTIQATGQNTSDEFIDPISGFVKSEITGRQFPILVSDNGNLVSPDGYGIPAKHQFNIAAVISDSVISGAEFLRDFGRMTFTFKYGNHTYTKHFTPEELEAEVRRTEIDLRPKPIQGVAGVRRKSQ